MKIAILIFAAFFNFYFEGTAQSDSDTLYPIDKKCEECLAKNIVKTSDMMTCFAEARDAWEKEMNSTYQQLLTSLDKEQSSKLISSQQAWSTYKEKEFELASSVYYGQGVGMEKRIDCVALQSAIYKRRALDLKQYLEM